MTRETWWNEVEGRVERLTGLWKEGYSAAQCARIMRTESEDGSKPTRNAVISKLHRLGLVGFSAEPRLSAQKPKPRREKPKVERKQPPKKIQPAIPIEAYVPIEPDYVPPVEQQVASVLDLEHEHCRWPLGEPGKNLTFCGGPRFHGPYCSHHASIAFETIEVRMARAARFRAAGKARANGEEGRRGLDASPARAPEIEKEDA